MTVFRILLSIIFSAILAYTLVVINHHGANLLPVFFGDIASLSWPGQFNFDFLCLLILSGVWVAWRHQFTAPGIGLGLCTALGGALFLSAYLFVETLRVRGDGAALLLGMARRKALTPIYQ